MKKRNHFSGNTKAVTAILLAVLMVCGIFMAAAFGLPGRGQAAKEQEKEMIVVSDRTGMPAALWTGEGTVRLGRSTGPALSRLLGAPADLGGSPYSVLGAAAEQKDSGFLKRLCKEFWKDSRDTNIRLTVNAEFSSEIYKLLEETGAERGAVLVYNYRTGEILAAVSSRGFPDLKDALKEDGSFDSETCSNLPFQETFMIGSVIKPILVAAALETDPALADLSYDCKGIYIRDDTTVRCFHGSRHGLIGNAAEGLSDLDCNGYPLFIMGQADPAGFYEKLKAFGFDGSFSGDGQIPYADPVFGGEPDRMRGADLLLAGIGQGRASSSMVGLARAYAALFNGGESPAPRILKDAPAGESLTMCSAETAGKILEGMEKAAEGRRICTAAGFGEYADGSFSNAVWALEGVHPGDLQKGDDDAWLVLTCLDHYSFREDEDTQNTALALTGEILSRVLETDLSSPFYCSRTDWEGLRKKLEANGDMPGCWGVRQIRMYEFVIRSGR